MRMFKKCLFITLLVYAIFTIKSYGYTYGPEDPFETNWDSYNQGDFISNRLKYSILNNDYHLEFYDFFTSITRSSAMGNIYYDYYNVLYKNSNTQEYVIHYFYQTYRYDLYSKFYYINGNNCYELNFDTHKNSSDYSTGNACLVFDFNNDNSIKNIYCFDCFQSPRYNDNNYFRIYIDNSYNIYTMGNCNFYTYNVANNTTTPLYTYNNYPWTCISSLDLLPNFNTSDYIFCPTYTALSYNHTKPWVFTLDNDYLEFNSNYCNGIYEDSGNIPYYGDYSATKVVWNAERGIIQDLSKSITLYIQDMNLNKQFKFNISVPCHKEDAAYYGFLNNYVRNNSDSVTASFSIFELWTPLEYTR